MIKIEYTDEGYKVINTSNNKSIDNLFDKSTLFIYAAGLVDDSIDKFLIDIIEKEDIQGKKTYTVTLPECWELGILSKYFNRVDKKTIKLKEEFIGKIYSFLVYDLIESYLYCLNTLDFPDLDNWVKEYTNRAVIVKERRYEED